MKSVLFAVIYSLCQAEIFPEDPPWTQSTEQT